MKLLISILLIAISTSVLAQENQQPLVKLLSPKVYDTPEVLWESAKDQGAIRALFYQTLEYKGKPTRAFAYMGIPKSNKPVPAMVLVHGGGGKAFNEWVKIWNDRGYAAISMSLEGHMPDENGEGKYKYEYSGPARVGRFDDVEKPLEAQWMYHAVSDILIAHSLLASLPEVDASRIGITGISWGGILSSLVSGVDSRLKCAMPVYGAGYLYESKGHFGDHGNSTPEYIEMKKFWDPAKQFSTGSVPTLWVNGDSDGHFSLNITSHSFEVTAAHAFMTIHPGMRHGHGPGWNLNEVPEIYAFADHILKGIEPGLGQITKQPSGKKVRLQYKSELPIKEAAVYYLNEKLTYRRASETDKHARPGKWQKVLATVDESKNTVSAKLPEGAQTYYVNLTDSRGFIISSELVEL